MSEQKEEAGDTGEEEEEEAGDTEGDEENIKDDEKEEELDWLESPGLGNGDEKEEEKDKLESPGLGEEWYLTPAEKLKKDPVLILRSSGTVCSSS